VQKYIHGREHYRECNTLLPGIAVTEVVKCVQYLRMDIEIFEELLPVVNISQFKNVSVTFSISVTLVWCYYARI